MWRNGPRLCSAPLRALRCVRGTSTIRSILIQSSNQTHVRLLAANFARALLSASHPLFKEKGAGKAGRRLAPANSRARTLHTQGTGAKQGSRNIRPSLRSGLTAYARSPRRRVPSCLRRLAKFTSSPRLKRRRLRKRLDRSNDGQDHAFSPYAFNAVRRVRLVARSRGSSRPARGRRIGAVRVHRSPIRGS
jgi:hypothetical protein